MSDEFVFTDKKGRSIRLQCCDPTICAYCDGAKVGELGFRDYDDGLIMSFIEVKEGYRRAGIAVEMIKFAKEYVGDFALPGLSWNARRDDQLHTTQDGRAFLSYCFRSRILSKTNSADSNDCAEERDVGESADEGNR
jgi:GNAT superfamily N-acetyltransferase